MSEQLEEKVDEFDVDLDACMAGIWNTNYDLMPHQIIGVTIMLKRVLNGYGFVLADDMGLGKTCQALALCLSYLHHYPNRKIIIMAGPSLMSNWFRETKKFFRKNYINVANYPQDSSSRLRYYKNVVELGEWDILIAPTNAMEKWDFPFI